MIDRLTVSSGKMILRPDSNEATERFLREQIGSSNADFWTIDDNGILLGESYDFHKLADEELADGKGKVYIGAFYTFEVDHRPKGVINGGLTTDFAGWLNKEVLDADKYGRHDVRKELMERLRKTLEGKRCCLPHSGIVYRTWTLKKH